MTIQDAFDFQVENLIKKGYPAAAHVTEETFADLVKPLRTLLPSPQREFQEDSNVGKLSFVIVVQSKVVPIEIAMGFTELNGIAGITKLFPHHSHDFQTLSTEIIPDKSAYLLVDIDRGKESINLAPQDALKNIRQLQRLPLTIDEGVAIITHYPWFLQKNNCFSLLASRHSGDQRVPAIWINGKKQPNLGWCWDGNPHSWLGSASGAQRI